MTIRRDTIYNLLGHLVSLSLSVLTIPTYLHLIGEARFGALTIVWLLIGYFGLFDLGLGQATTQSLAKGSKDGLAAQGPVFWSALIANAALGLTGGMLAWPLAAWFFGSQFPFGAVLRAELMSALPWIALTVPVVTVSSVLAGALQARKRFLELNLVSLLGSVLMQLVPLAVAWGWSTSLAVLIPSVLVGRLLTALLLFLLCKRHVFGDQGASWQPELAAQLLRFGGWVSVTAVVGPMMVILDRFAIGLLFGAKAVSQYSIPFQLVERTTLLSSALNAALFPRLATLASPSEQSQLAQQALRFLALLLTPLIAAGMLLIGPFLAWWIAPELSAASTRLSQTLLLGFWVNSLALVPYTQLLAGGRPDLVAKCHAAELLPYLASLYLALQHFGLVGAATVFSLRAAVDFVLLAHLAGTLPHAVRLLALPAGMLGLVFVAAAP
jgi:O-antigen/teichoic acid export membrane protein